MLDLSQRNGSNAVTRLVIYILTKSPTSAVDKSNCLRFTVAHDGCSSNARLYGKQHRSERLPQRVRALALLHISRNSTGYLHDSADSPFLEISDEMCRLAQNRSAEIK